MAYTAYTGNITITNPGAVTGSTYTIGAGGGGAGSASVTIPSGGYTLATGSSGSMWTSTAYNYSPAVNITSNGISLDDKADITLGNISLKETLDKIQDRLAILVPDPKKLEKYEALKQAYEHYKLLEALCNEEEEK